MFGVSRRDHRSPHREKDIRSDRDHNRSRSRSHRSLHDTTNVTSTTVGQPGNQQPTDVQDNQLIERREHDQRDRRFYRKHRQPIEDNQQSNQLSNRKSQGDVEDRVEIEGGGRAMWQRVW